MSLNIPEQQGGSLPTFMPGHEFANEFLQAIAATNPGDEAGITTMQVEAQLANEESIVFDILCGLIDARKRGVDARLMIDTRYVDSMTRVGNRDFPDRLPLLRADHRAERQANRSMTAVWLDMLQQEGALQPAGPHRIERGYVPRLRHLGSFHPAQRLFAARHMKAAYVANTKGEVRAWVNSANLTDSDLLDPAQGYKIGMNNLSLAFTGRPAAFIMGAVNSSFHSEAGMHTYTEGSTLIHDIGNSGEPARLPRILNEALKAIDPRRSEVITNPEDNHVPKPKTIVVLSQYAPDGILYSALADASADAQVFVPLEPTNDHRAKSFPYNLHNTAFKARAKKLDGIETYHRKLASHIKCLVVTYDDCTAKLIVGTDNFVTHLQKAVRNEELAAVIDLDGKKAQDGEYFAEFVDLLFGMGEITQEIKTFLLQDLQIN